MRRVKHDKTEEIIHRLAAEFVRDESSPSSLITITRVELTPAGKDAAVFFTTLPESQEDTALKFLERKTGEFKKFVLDKSRLGIVPHLTFKIDYGERNRQRLDEISRES
ncbi:ribosome-binding factor A [Candidatus Parcubacteria bacterium]|nr:ribosome-binding factor A [Candidatus Parcubacteria bacterium]